MSPRSRVPSSGDCLCTPPMSSSRMPRFTSSCPCTVGAMECASKEKMSRLARISSISSSAAVLKVALTASSSSPSSRMLMSPKRASAEESDEARKHVLYASSRTPSVERPDTPPASAPRPSCLERTSVRCPVCMPSTSGETTNEPVKTALSPALARSTFSSRTITSSVRGMQPAGISEVFSCTRTRCQSANLERFTSSVQTVRLVQLFCAQHIGSV
mmetsp:Transcript_23081/g.58597  ORF Transcript_23081/g.58597 Transcript_23081/m.58597 type:complete len:216 (+) Transcript_23081:218-865(+)